jgi:hypothetical protein
MANNVLLVRHHAVRAMVHHRTTVSYVPPDNLISKGVVSMWALMECVQELAGCSLTTINRSVMVRFHLINFAGP